eukprot:9923464-Alexandrium_andersonii.AAC.1
MLADHIGGIDEDVLIGQPELRLLAARLLERGLGLMRDAVHGPLVLQAELLLAMALLLAHDAEGG